jgi:hypothetical protein
MGLKMIKISSFYLFSNFLRITQEFFDDKIVIKQKSLTADHNYEVLYEQIAKIKFRKYSHGDQMNLGLSLVIIPSLIFLFFIPNLSSNVIAQRVGQVTLIIGAILYLTGFAKYKHCFFFDKNNNLLNAININTSNQERAKIAIELVKQKSKIIEEANPEIPFPESEPIHEFVDYDISDSLYKSTTRFYKTELIDHEKSLTDEAVTCIKYNELNGKITHGKSGNSNWTPFGCNLMYLGLVILSFPKIFNLPTTKFELILAITFGILSIIAFLLRFVKGDIVYFENQENRIVYSMRITKRNKEQVDQILQFIEQKTNKKKSVSK